MNRLELLYQDSSIEIYIKSDLLSVEYYLCDNAKILARYYGQRLQRMYFEVKNIPFSYLEKFHEVVINHVLKDVI